MAAGACSVTNAGYVPCTAQVLVAPGAGVICCCLQSCAPRCCLCCWRTALRIGGASGEFMASTRRCRAPRATMLSTRRCARSPTPTPQRKRIAWQAGRAHSARTAGDRARRGLRRGPGGSAARPAGFARGRPPRRTPCAAPTGALPHSFTLRWALSQQSGARAFSK